MRGNLLIKALIITSCTALIIGCSTMKHGGKNNNATTEGSSETSVQTEGLSNESNFAEQTNADKLRAPFDQTYYFDFDKDIVHQGDLASINAQATYLVAHANARVRIEGHADERGSREYNVALGWRRAKAVANVLKQQGVHQNQIAIVSYGKEKPAAFGHDESSYSLNRRVKLIYEIK